MAPIAPPCKQQRASFQPMKLRLGRGRPQPYGCSQGPDAGFNFSILAPTVESAWLMIEVPTKEDTEAYGAWPGALMKLSATEHRTGPAWHVEVLGCELVGCRYCWLLDPILGENGRPVKSAKRIMDPCARMLDSRHAELFNSRDGPKFSPSACVPNFRALGSFNWEGVQKPGIPMKDYIIYEVHCRSFTMNPDSALVDKSSAGTFRGFIEKIPHLMRIGVNCVELLPIFEFDESACPRKHPKTDEYLCNYWGYQTCSYYVPMQRFASKAEYYSAVVEFKTLVRECHRYGIEVVLDVVFNHTGEGAWGESNWHSLSAIAETSYYLMSNGYHTNYTGCGNTVNANDPVCAEWIIDCLRYWALEMQVDGFRFDLASSLTRGADGQCNIFDPLLIKKMAGDPMLKDVKLIAEPWDCAWPDGYLVGKFPNCGPPRFAEWNGKFRDAIRKFIKGDDGMKGQFATRICGSADLYQEDGRGPCHSINFVTAHDGFTLHDLVSYNEKNNSDNNEESGDDNNMSWNCGSGPSFDGPVEDLEVLALRQRQMRNMMCALFLSAGTPMFTMGDEYGRTQNGNNNTWCQDELNWFSWEECAKEEGGLMRFTRLLTSLRAQHGEIFNRTSFFNDKDIQWTHESWDNPYNFISFILTSPPEARSGQNSEGGSLRGSVCGDNGSQRDAASVAASVQGSQVGGSGASVVGTEAGRSSASSSGRSGNLQLLVAFNSGHEVHACFLPQGKEWYRLIDTHLPSPQDFSESDEDAVLITGDCYMMNPYSCIVLKSYQELTDSYTYGNMELECGGAEQVAEELRAVVKRGLTEELLAPASSLHHQIDVHYDFDPDPIPAEPTVAGKSETPAGPYGEVSPTAIGA